MDITVRRIIVLLGIMIMVMTMACGSDDDDDDTVAATGEQAAGDQPGNNGGGGQAGGGAESGPAVLPAVLDFNLIVNETTTAPVIITQSGRTPERSVEITNTSSQQITGNVTLAQEQATPSRVTLNAGNVVAVTARNFWGETARDMTITVAQDIPFPAGIPAAEENLPESGAFVISYTLLSGARESVVVIFSNPSRDAGVSVRLNEQMPVTMGSQAFKGLLNSTAPGWQQKANLSYLLLEKVAKAVYLSTQSVAYIEANRDVLVSSGTAGGGNGSITVTGDPFRPANTPNPFPESGTRTFIWTDVSGDGAVNAGDSFLWIFSSYWENDEGSLVNDITTGRLELNGFTLSTRTQDSRNVITGTGFQSTDQGRPGVLLIDLEDAQVEETTPGTVSFDADRIFRINGGFDIFFNEPTGAEG